MVFCDDAVAVSPSFFLYGWRGKTLTTIIPALLLSLYAVYIMWWRSAAADGRTDGRTYKGRGLLTTGPMCVCAGPSPNTDPVIIYPS
jgi:hypothetical protein